MGANAQTSVPAFVAGQVLTAQQQTQINTGVPVFATTTTRDAAFGGTGEKVLAEGQLAYIEASNIVQYYDGTSWLTLAPTTSAVVQIKSTTKSDTFSMSSSTFADVTGLSVSITPTSASNNVLIFGALSAGNNTNNSVSVYPRLMRDSTAIGLGDAAGSRRRITSNASFLDNNSNMTTIPFMYLDSPATTSATTYKIQVSAQTTNTIYVNRTNDDSDSDVYPRAISTITVMEVTP